MDTLLLARLQFATTTSIHFLFVVVTLGLVTLLVGLQTAGFLTGKPVYERMTRFWGQLYVINYVLGIATGIVMEFQFGLNWSGLSRYVGNVFGAPLAIETLVAFFLESTFLGMWIFGWHRLRRGVHLALLWGVALDRVRLGLLDHGRQRLAAAPGRLRGRATASPTSPTSARCSPTPPSASPSGTWSRPALLTGGMLMAAVSAWHLIRRTADYALFRKSLRIGLVTARPGGHAWCRASASPSSARSASCSPPSSAAARTGDAQIAEWTARFGPGDYTPPALSSVGLGFMILIGFTLGCVWLLLPLLWRDWIIRLRFPLWLLLLALPLPVRRGDPRLDRPRGRPPALGRVRAAPHRPGRLPGRRRVMLTSLIGFSLLLGALAVTNWVLLARHAARGADDPALGRPPGARHATSAPNPPSPEGARRGTRLVRPARPLLRHLPRARRLRLRRRAAAGPARHPGRRAGRRSPPLGPFFLGNEVWLVAAVGILFGAFPTPGGRAALRPLPGRGRRAGRGDPGHRRGAAAQPAGRRAAARARLGPGGRGRQRAGRARLGRAARRAAPGRTAATPTATSPG